MTRPTPTAPDSRKLYDRLWRDSLRKGKEELGDLEQAIEFLKSLPVLTSRSVIVEIGCGTGKLCEALYRVGYEHAVGADIAQRALSFGKNRYPYLSLLCMDGATLALRSGSVDICLSFDFVEHLADVDRHFREVCRVLVAEGIYLFQTPNRITNPIIETIRWRGWRWRVYHRSLQWPWALKKKLLRAGFETVSFVKIPPLSDHKLRQVPWPVRWLFVRLPWKRLPLLCQTNFFVVAHK